MAKSTLRVNTTGEERKADPTLDTGLRLLMYEYDAMNGLVNLRLGDLDRNLNRRLIGWDVDRLTESSGSQKQAE